MKKILVIGSLNMDFDVTTRKAPAPGETIMGDDVKLVPGGKGANQAYAIGKLGGDASMIGCVGNDTFGEQMRANLESVNVGTGGIKVIDGVPTGQAFITIEESGQNSIIVIAGANAKADRKVIDDNMKYIEEADVIVMQLEIPIDTVIYAKERAKTLGKTVIIDPAPAVSGLPDEFWKGADFIKPNETELSILTGLDTSDMANVIRGAHIMLGKGVKAVLVSLGEKGVMYV